MSYSVLFGGIAAVLFGSGGSSCLFLGKALHSLHSENNNSADKERYDAECTEGHGRLRVIKSCGTHNNCVYGTYHQTDYKVNSCSPVLFKGTLDYLDY